MLQTPALLASIVLASIYAALFFLWQGHGFRDLLFFWLAALVGFASGHLVGMSWGFIPWTIGQVHFIEASLMTFLFLAIARWLRHDRNPEPEK
jgi:ribose/xylose/arabinose/galactoside ABC-type transport system permease subunit